jgi:enoyl-CoA hydratase
VSATSDAVTVSQTDAVTLVVMDDGKANALNHELIDALRAVLRAAEADSRALVLAGRPGRFSAGFDLSVMTAGPDAAMPLLQAGADLAIEIFMSRVPVVLGVTGHALAMGAILLMAADVRIGTEGDFKIGMNEVRIGMPVPRFATELARDRLSKLHFVPAIQHATIYDPVGAIEAGYLDQVVPEGQATEAAVAHATLLAENLRQGAFQLTRDIARGPVADVLRAGIAADMAEAGFGGPL